jgi:hypothetical protein
MMQTTERCRLPRETFGMLHDRGFSPTVFGDPCKEAASIDLRVPSDLVDRGVGTVDFKCRYCGRTGHCRLAPPFRIEKRRLHEQAAACRGAADASRRLHDLRLRYEGCRRRATVVIVPSWYRRKGFDVVRRLAAEFAAE